MPRYKVPQCVGRYMKFLKSLRVQYKITIFAYKMPTSCVYNVCILLLPLLITAKCYRGHCKKGWSGVPRLYTYKNFEYLRDVYTYILWRPTNWIRCALDAGCYALGAGCYALGAVR